MGHVSDYPFWGHYFCNDSSQAVGLSEHGGGGDARAHAHDRFRETPNCVVAATLDEWTDIYILFYL